MGTKPGHRTIDALGMTVGAHDARCQSRPEMHAWMIVECRIWLEDARMGHPRKNLQFLKKYDLGPRRNFVKGKCPFLNAKKSTFPLGNLYKNAHPTTALCITGLGAG